jgi:uncharacterized coiled-coil DUF342 family protein
MLFQSLLSFLFGVVASFIGFVIKESWQNTKTKKSKMDAELAMLRSIRNEIEFYHGKLKQLSQELRPEYFRRDDGVILPSYDFYPSFIERSKNEMLGTSRDDELIRIVGNCHFELCHTQGKLTSFRMNVNQRRRVDEELLVNADGLRQLVDNTASEFEHASRHIDVAIAQLNKKREAFKENNPFGPWLDPS